MHLACLFRGYRKWIFFSIILLTVSYCAVISNRSGALDNVKFSSQWASRYLSMPTEASGEHELNQQHVLAEHSSSVDPDDLVEAAVKEDVAFATLGGSVTISAPSTTFLTIATSTASSRDDNAPKEQNDPTTSPTATTSMSVANTPSLVPDAHRLPSNDGFLPHLAALAQGPNLTVTDAMSKCDFTEKELSHFQYNEDAPWRVDLTIDLFIALKREEWMSFIQNDLIPWSNVSSRFEGQGIVVVAGHPRSIMRLKVTLRALIELGSTLPVEVHYYGDELSPASQQELIALYDPLNTGTRLHFNDLSDSNQILESSYNKKIHINYNLKTAALINSRFLEPLLLDSDNIPAIDPRTLWASETYKEYGSVFWPDFSRTRPEHPAWAITNTYCRKDEYEFESGQVLVDKRRFFYHLQLAAWWNEQKYWNDILLGDKDTFRFAWHALKTAYGTPYKSITSVGFVAEQEYYGELREGYCGHTFAQHHPDFKDGKQLELGTKSGIAFFHGGTLKSVSAPLLTRLRENRGGIFTHYKRSQYDEDWSGIEYDVGLRYWSAGFYYNMTSEPVLTGEEDFDKDGKPISEEALKNLTLTREDRHANVLCTDWGEIEAKPLSLIGEEGFEKKFEDAGGYWAVEDAYRWGKSGA